MNFTYGTKDENFTALRRFKWNEASANLHRSVTYFSQGTRFPEPSQGFVLICGLFSGIIFTGPSSEAKDTTIYPK
jgi:hypothetical protein